MGMSWTHSHAQTLSLMEHATEQRRLHRHVLAKLQSSSGHVTSSSSESETDEQPSESESDTNCYFLQVKEINIFPRTFAILSTMS